MPTIHLVYPHGQRISCPDAIGRELGKRLRERYAVRQYDWHDTRAIEPEDGDILLGHPHPAPWTIFQRSMNRTGWTRVLVLAPFAPAYAVQQAFEDRVIERADRFLAITGNYWYATAGRSLFAHWLPKMVHVDLAVDRADFPPLKVCFNEPGKRRFIYIGGISPVKNTPYLSELARRMPETEFAWIGGAAGQTIAGLRALGFQDFRDGSARQLVAGFDFLITVGTSDANPTTILEAMAWGLIPICTPQSGYAKFAGIPNIPLDDPASAEQVLRKLQTAPESELRRLQIVNWSLLDEHFNWDRFAAQIIDAIESRATRTDRAASFVQQLRIRYATLRSVVYFRHLYISAAYTLLWKQLRAHGIRGLTGGGDAD